MDDDDDDDDDEGDAAADDDDDDDDDDGYDDDRKGGGMLGGGSHRWEGEEGGVGTQFCTCGGGASTVHFSGAPLRRVASGPPTARSAWTMQRNGSDGDVWGSI